MTIISVRERYKKIKLIRKQMQMTRRCSRELDIILSLIGVDYSKIEIHPESEETE